MVQQKKRTKKRSPIRVNRKKDRSLKRVKKNKRTMKKNKNRNKKFMEGGALVQYEKPKHDVASTWEPFTYEYSGKKYLTFYHNNGRPDSLYEFTNFYGSPFTYDGVNWPTAEHYFQSCKSIVAGYLNENNDYTNLSGSDTWKNKMLQYASLTSAGDVFNAGSRIDFNSQLKPKFWGGFRPGTRIGMNDGYFKQPSALKYQIMLNALYQKFTQNKRFRDLLVKYTTDYILVEDSRSNDDSWGNGFKRKAGKVWDTTDEYYKGLWTGLKGDMVGSDSRLSKTPYNCEDHRNNILGITLTCLGKLFISFGDTLPHEHTDIKISCVEWLRILQIELGYDVSDLFNIFPWEHWTTSLKRKNTSLKQTLKNIEGTTFNSYKANVDKYKNGYGSGINVINYIIRDLGEVNGCEIFDYLKSIQVSPFYTYYFTDLGYTKKMLEEIVSSITGGGSDKDKLKGYLDSEKTPFMKDDNHELLNESDLNNGVKQDTKFVALSDTGHYFFKDNNNGENENEKIREGLKKYFEDGTNFIDLKSKFKIKFGLNARSVNVPCEKSMSGIVQENMNEGDDKGNTRIVTTMRLYKEIMDGYDPTALLSLVNIEEIPESSDPPNTDLGGINIVLASEKITIGSKEVSTTTDSDGNIYVDGFLVLEKEGSLFKPPTNNKKLAGAEPLDFYIPSTAPSALTEVTGVQTPINCEREGHTGRENMLIEGVIKSYGEDSKQISRKMQEYKKSKLYKDLEWRGSLEQIKSDPNIQEIFSHIDQTPLSITTTSTEVVEGPPQPSPAAPPSVLPSVTPSALAITEVPPVHQEFKLNQKIKEYAIQSKQVELSVVTPDDYNNLYSTFNQIIAYIINKYEGSKHLSFIDLENLISLDIHGKKKLFDHLIKDEGLETDDKENLIDLLKANFKVAREVPSGDGPPVVDPDEFFVKLKVKNSRGDGNCGFHSVIYAINKYLPGGLKELKPNADNTRNIFNGPVLSFKEFCNSNYLQGGDFVNLKVIDIETTQIYDDRHIPGNYAEIKRDVINLFRAYLMYLLSRLDINDQPQHLHEYNSLLNEINRNNFAYLLYHGIKKEDEDIPYVSQLQATDGISPISFLLGIPIINSIRVDPRYGGGGIGWQIHLPNIKDIFKSYVNPINCLNPKQGNTYSHEYFSYKIMEDTFIETYEDKSGTGGKTSTDDSFVLSLFKHGYLQHDGSEREARFVIDIDKKDKVVKKIKKFLVDLNPKPLFFHSEPGHYQYSEILESNPVIPANPDADADLPLSPLVPGIETQKGQVKPKVVFFDLDQTLVTQGIKHALPPGNTEILMELGHGMVIFTTKEIIELIDYLHGKKIDMYIISRGHNIESLESFKTKLQNKTLFPESNCRWNSKPKKVDIQSILTDNYNLLSLENKDNILFVDDKIPKHDMNGVLKGENYITFEGYPALETLLTAAAIQEIKDKLGIS